MFSTSFKHCFVKYHFMLKILYLKKFFSYFFNRPNYIYIYYSHLIEIFSKHQQEIFSFYNANNIIKLDFAISLKIDNQYLFNLTAP